MDDSPHMLETVPVGDRRLRCVFSRENEVFRHTVELVNRESTTRLLVSVDSEHGDWPTSPPWQELHAERRPDGSRVLLVVGRAGKSHWSMSVIVDSEHNAILFDVACRLREQPEFLGTTYERLREGADVSLVELDNEASSATVRELAEQLVIDATQQIQPPATLRWAYRIELT